MINQDFKLQNNQIQIVDDSDANLLFLNGILTAEGYKVQSAINGETALQHIKEQLPDLIILDVMMPEMDGFEVCQSLKSDSRTSNIPVIFISAGDDNESKMKGFELGAVDFINKPFRKEEILARIKTHINLSQMRNQLVQKTIELNASNHQLQTEIARRKQVEVVLEKKIVALTQPLDTENPVHFDELFNLSEIQKLQDQFAEAFGIASIITQTDGTPITNPSNFCRLCNDIIRKTEIGLKNCMNSDAVLGKHNPKNPTIQPCLSGGLWDAGASITVSGKHVANWLIGQVRNESLNEDGLKNYARNIGADEQEFMKAHSEVPVMSEEQFRKISDVLFTMAGQLSEMAYQNVVQARFINDHKQALESLEQSEEQYRTTLYGIGDGVITTNQNGYIRLMNQVAEDLTGWTQAEAEGLILEDVFHIVNEQNREKVEIPVRKVLREGLTVGLANHTLLISKDGTETPIADSGAPIRNTQGEIVGVVLVFRDQTKERDAERALRESEFFFRESQRAANIGSYNYSLVTGFWESSEVLDQIFGIDKEYVRSVDGWENLIYPDDLEMMDKHLKEDVIRNRKPFSKEYRIVRKSDREIRWVNGLGQLNFDSNGNIISLIGTIQDITSRKLTEEILKGNEEKFRNIFEHSPIGKSMTSIDGSIHVNRAFCEMLGYTETELKEKKWSDISHPEDFQRSNELIQNLLEGKIKDARIEKRYIHKNGSVIWTDVSTFLQRDRDGNPEYFITSVNNITQRKKAEESLRRNERKFRALIENSSDAISLVDSNGLEIYHSPSCQRILGFTAEERMGKSIMELVHPDDRENLMGLFSSVLQRSGIATLNPIRVRHLNGSWLWIEGIANNLLADPDIQAIVINFRDVTERKLVEIKLQRSEQELKKAQQITHIGSFYIDLITNQVTWTEELYKMYGFDPTLPPPLLNESQTLFTPESWELLSTSIANTAATGVPYEIELITIKIDGSNGFMWARGETVKDVAGNIIGLWGAAQDISARKHAENRLSESEEKFRTLVASSSDGISLFDLKGNILFANECKAKMLKANSATDLIGVNTYTLLTPLYREKLIELTPQFLENGYLRNIEAEVLCLDGTTFLAELNITLVSDPQGKPSYIMDSIRDISDRKKAEKAILEANQKMNSFFEQSLDGFFFMMFDEPIDWNETSDKEQLLEYSFLNLKISRVNDAMLSQYGAELSQILGSCFCDFFAHDLEQGKKVLQKVLDNGKLQIETEERKLNGDTMFVEGDYTCLYDSQRKITGLFGIQRDITESKRNLETIRNERTLLRTLINNLPVTVYVKDKEARKIVANTLDLATIGIMDETLVLGKTDLELFDNEVGRRGYEDDLNVIRTAKPVLNREEYFFNENGEKQWLLTSKMPLLDDHGKPSGLVGIGREITEIKKAEEQIKKLTKSIEQSPSSIVITDIYGTIEYVNPKFSEITGYTSEEAIGQNPRILKSDKTSEEGYKQLWDTISVGNVWRGEFLNRKKNGETYWEWATITSIKNELGIITNYIAIKEDISIRKQMEVDLILAKNKAEESDRLKSAFLANMSHEIRTPLNSIIGFSELLSDADFELDQKNEFIAHIIDNGNNLLNIISDIMDISKMESGEITIRKGQVPVNKFMLGIKEQFKIKPEDKNLELKLDIPAIDEEIFIAADVDRLRQIFNNLLSNAIKFTPNGYIRIGYHRKSEMVEFYVEDTGIGIPDVYHNKIFDRFRQVESFTTRKYGGNGLGLAITRNLVELMGGTIWLESELGKGSTFYFTIPGIK